MPETDTDTEPENKFDPDYCVHPGATLHDWMVENRFYAGGEPYREGHSRLLVKPVATACGRMDPARLQRILDGDEEITDEIAHKLHAGTDIPAFLWVNLERQFRKGLAEGKNWVR